MLLLPCNTNNISQYIESLKPEAGEAVMLLFGEQDAPDIPALIGALKKMGVTFFGGVFPGLVYGNQSTTTGCIVKKFQVLWKPFLTKDLTAARFSGFPTQEYPDYLGGGTAVVFLDGLSQNMGGFLDHVNNLLGEHCVFIGGGAGSISLEQRPCVFTNEGFYADAAVVCVVKNQVSLGVRHGWQHLAGPLVATKTKRNVILELNWEPALTVYSRIIEEDCGIKLDIGNFASMAKGYPLGMLREKEDDVVRDPLTIGDNDSIVCIAEVPTNTVLHVLKGKADALLQAAKMAVEDCGKEVGIPIQSDATLVVDCITRRHFLDDEFTQELNLVRDKLVIDSPEKELFGILSLGEISSTGRGLLEVYNKTIVVGTFH